MTDVGVWRPSVRWGVTAQFERFVLAVVVCFAVYRLILSFVAPDDDPLPLELIMTVILLVVGYLWMGKSRATHELVVAELGAVSALVATMEAKDSYTRGHSDRVRRIAVELARKMRLNDDRVGIVERAALLHDLGKVGVPDAILCKPASLTDAEYAILRHHPQRTAEILAMLGFLDEESRVAALHYECYDKSMGPAGGIPVETSIIAVADAFDAMNSNRPYRSRMPREKVVNELRASRGSQHQPEVVDAFLELLEEQPRLWDTP